MYIMQSEREALQRMVCSFADEYGLTVRTRDFDGDGWVFSFYKNETKMKPELFFVKWDELTSIYAALQAIVENALRSNPTLDAIRVGRMMYQGFADGVKGTNKITIKDVIFNPPATIVLWSDGSKTVVRTQNDDAYDPEKGLAMAISKRFLGNSGRYYNTFKKYIADGPILAPNIPDNVVYHHTIAPQAVDRSFIRNMLGKWKLP